MVIPYICRLAQSLKRTTKAAPRRAVKATPSNAATAAAPASKAEDAKPAKDASAADDSKAKDKDSK